MQQRAISGSISKEHIENILHTSFEFSLSPVYELIFICFDVFVNYKIIFMITDAKIIAEYIFKGFRM
jgi:hypothetical protein